MTDYPVSWIKISGRYFFSGSWRIYGFTCACICPFRLKHTICLNALNGNSGGKHRGSYALIAVLPDLVKEKRTQVDKSGSKDAHNFYTFYTPKRTQLGLGPIGVTFNQRGSPLPVPSAPIAVVVVVPKSKNKFTHKLCFLYIYYLFIYLFFPDWNVCKVIICHSSHYMAWCTSSTTPIYRKNTRKHTQGFTIG